MGRPCECVGAVGRERFVEIVRTDAERCLEGLLPVVRVSHQAEVLEQRGGAGAFGEPFRGEEAETAPGRADRPGMPFEHVELSQGKLGAARPSSVIVAFRGVREIRIRDPLVRESGVLIRAEDQPARPPGIQPLPSASRGSLAGDLEHQRFDIARRLEALGASKEIHVNGDGVGTPAKRGTPRLTPKYRAVDGADVVESSPDVLVPPPAERGEADHEERLHFLELREDVSLRLLRDITEERDRRLPGPRLPPADCLRGLDPQAVAVVEPGDVAHGAGSRDVPHVPLCRRVPAPCAHHGIAEGSHGLRDRGAVPPRPAHKVAPGAERKQHPFVGHGPDPLDGRGAVEPQPQPHARP